MHTCVFYAVKILYIYITVHVLYLMMIHVFAGIKQEQAEKMARRMGVSPGSMDSVRSAIMCRTIQYCTVLYCTVLQCY